MKTGVLFAHTRKVFETSGKRTTKTLHRSRSSDEEKTTIFFDSIRHFSRAISVLIYYFALFINAREENITGNIFLIAKGRLLFQAYLREENGKKPLSYTNLWMKTLQRYYFSNAFWKINLWRNIYKMKLTIFMKILTC